jgi:hypothetical protein
MKKRCSKIKFKKYGQKRLKNLRGVLWEFYAVIQGMHENKLM